MVQGRGAGVVRWVRTATVGVLAAGVVLGGCGVDEPEANPVQSRPVASPSVTWTGERPAAGTFPAVIGALTTWIAYSRGRVTPLVSAPRRVLRAA